MTIKIIDSGELQEYLDEGYVIKTDAFALDRIVVVKDEPAEEQAQKLFVIDIVNQINAHRDSIKDAQKVFDDTRYKQEKLIDGRMTEEEYAPIRQLRAAAATTISWAREEIEKLKALLPERRRGGLE